MATIDRLAKCQVPRARKPKSQRAQVPKIPKVLKSQTARLLKKRKHHFVWNRRKKIAEIFLLSAIY
jgi:hypothetical protein